MATKKTVAKTKSASSRKARAEDSTTIRVLVISFTFLSIVFAAVAFATYN